MSSSRVPFCRLLWHRLSSVNIIYFSFQETMQYAVDDAEGMFWRNFDCCGATTYIRTTLSRTVLRILDCSVYLLLFTCSHTLCTVLNVMLLSVVLANVVLLNVTQMNVTQLNVTQMNVILINGIWLNIILLNAVLLNVILPNVILPNVTSTECHLTEYHSPEYHSAECHTAECHTAECHTAECHTTQCLSRMSFRWMLFFRMSWRHNLFQQKRRIVNETFLNLVLFDFGWRLTNILNNLINHHII